MTAVSTTFTTRSRHVFLRTGDAVHLLTARQNGLDEVFSNDERLLAAASEIGIVGRNVIGRLPTMRAPLGRAIVTFPYMRRLKTKHPAYPLPARRRRRRRLLRIALLLLAFNLAIPPYVRPAQGEVTSRFFLRTRPEKANPLALEVHKGIDFAAPRGSPVRAAKSGIVDTVGSSPTLGTYAIIRHWLGFSTLYAHLDSARTRAGRPVVKWARIGSAGQSGRATGPHLHFEVRWLGRRLPPGPFLAIDSARRALWRLVRPGQR